MIRNAKSIENPFKSLIFSLLFNAEATMPYSFFIVDRTIRTYGKIQSDLIVRQGYPDAIHMYYSWNIRPFSVMHVRSMCFCDFSTLTSENNVVIWSCFGCIVPSYIDLNKISFIFLLRDCIRGNKLSR